MADKLRKFRKDNYVEKRFGKDINVSTKEDAPLRKEMTAAETKSVSKAQPSSGASPLSFSAAFAAARKDGDKTFTWKGKSYTTQLASEKKAAPAPARRSPPATSTRTNTPTAAPKQVNKPGIPAAAKAVADKAAGYRAAFQRQDGQAGFSKPKVAAAAPAPAPKPAAKVDVAKRSQDAARANSRSLGMRPANFATVSEERRKQIEEAQKRGYAKGGSVRSVDGIAKRGKTRAPMKRK